MPIVIDQEAQVIRDVSFWQGENDLSATVYVMWDEENLYLAADVTEDTPYGAIEMLPLDGEDNFKVYISTDPTADPARTAYGTNDFLLYLIVDNSYWDTAFDRTMVEKDLLERFTTKGMDGGEDVLTGYEKASVLTTTGFIYEAVSVSKKWQMPLFRGSKFGQPEVARICKELILQAKSTTREAGKAGLHEEKSEGLRPLRHLLKVF